MCRLISNTFLSTSLNCNLYHVLFYTIVKITEAQVQARQVSSMDLCDILGELLRELNETIRKPVLFSVLKNVLIVLLETNDFYNES